MASASKHLERKLASWQQAGLLSSAQADAIREHERTRQPQRQWGVLLFAGFGAVILGLGVILLFAYNWREMPKEAKLATVFTALAAAHSAGWLLHRRDPAHGLADSLHLLGTMFFGAGIWLVAQIYHISAHYPNAWLLWGLAALAMAIARPSIANGILSCLLLAIWAGAEAFDYHSRILYAPLPLLALGALAWNLRSPVLLAAVLVSLAFAVAASLPRDGEQILPALLAVAVTYAALSWLTRDSGGFPSSTAIFNHCGRLLYYPLLFLLTFHDLTEEILRAPGWRGTGSSPAPDATACLLVVALAIAAHALYRVRNRGAAHGPAFRQELLMPSVFVLGFTLLWLGAHTIPPMRPGTSSAHDAAAVLLALLATAAWLYHAIARLWSGCRDTRISQVVAGSLLLAAWAMARFADLFDSLLVRGVLFLLMGIVLFGIAIFFLRRKNQSQPASTSPAPLPSNRKDPD